MNNAPSTFLRYSIVIACLCLAASLRLYNYGFVFDNMVGHLNFIDTDCYYYLRRLVHFLSHFPQIMIFDPLADWPEGSMVDWPEGFLLLLGIPLKLAGVNSYRSLEIGACIIMVILGLWTCWVIYRASFKILKDSSFSLLVLFFVSFSYLLIRFSCFGQVDHHILEAVFPPLAFLFSLKAFDEKKMAWAVGLGLLIVFSLTVSSSSLFYIGAVSACYALVLGTRGNQMYFIFMSICALIGVALYAYWNYSVRHQLWSMTHPSFFHLVLLTILFVGAFLLARFRKYLGVISAVAFLICLFVYATGWPEPFVRVLSDSFYYVLGSGILGNVSEATPIFMNYEMYSSDFMHLNFGYLIYLLPFAWFSLFFWKKWDIYEKYFLLSLTLLSVPGVLQKRFSHIITGFFFIFVVWVLKKTLDWMKANELRVGGFVVLFVVGTILLPAFQYNFVPAGGSPREVVDLGATKAFIKKIELNQEDAWKRLALDVPVTEGIWANPNLGHLLLYVTGFGVVTNSFYHSNGFNIDFDLRTAKTDAEFSDLLQKYKIRYFFIADDWLFFNLQRQMRGLDLSAYVVDKTGDDGRPIRIYQMQAFNQHAWARFLIQNASLPKIEKIFEIHYNVPHFYTFVNGYKFTGF